MKLRVGYEAKVKTGMKSRSEAKKCVAGGYIVGSGRGPDIGAYHEQSPSE